MGAGAERRNGMIQKVIELGPGFSDLYELMMLIRTNRHRLRHILRIESEIADRIAVSFAAAFDPAPPSSFQPVYLCREGIRIKPGESNQRIAAMEACAQEVNKPIIVLRTKPSTAYADPQKYYMHLIALLRSGRYLPEPHNFW